MKARTVFLGLVSSIAMPAFAGGGTLGSVYNVTFYIEPGLAAGNTLCITLTKSDVNSPYTESGTYIDSSGAISGIWYVNGDEVMMSGYSSAYGDNVPFVGRLVESNSKFAGRFLDYIDSAGTILAGGTFIA